MLAGQVYGEVHLHHFVQNVKSIPVEICQSRTEGNAPWWKTTSALYSDFPHSTTIELTLSGPLWMKCNNFANKLLYTLVVPHTQSRSNADSTECMGKQHQHYVDGQLGHSLDF